MKNRRIKSAAILSGVIFAAILALPSLVDIDRFRPQLESSLASSLGREVHVGHMKISLLAGGARVEQISVADDPAFQDGTFLQAKSLGVGVSFLSLILSRSLHVTSLTLDEPKMTAIQSADGKWNFSSLGSTKGNHVESVDSTGTALPTSSFILDHLSISNATIELTSGQSGNRATTLRNIDVDLKNVSFDHAMSFMLSANTDTGKLKIEGEAGPINAADPDQTPFHASITANKVDLGQVASLGSSPSLGGILTMDATVKSDGKTVHSEGKASADKLRLARGAQPASQTVSLRYETNYIVAQKTGVIRNSEIQAGKGSASLSGSYDDHGKSLVIHARIAGNLLPTESIEGILPALGVVLPAGSKLHGGTVNANLSVDGPVDRMVTSGSVHVANAHLAGFDLASKLSTLPGTSPHNGSSNNGGADLSIMNLATHLRIAPEGTSISGLDGQFGGIGSITGNGNISSTDRLQFNMVAHVASDGLLRVGMNHAGMLNLPNDIPFQVVGTTSTPIIIPDLSGMTKTTAKGVVTNAAVNAGKGAVLKSTTHGQPVTAPVQTTSNKKTGFFHGLFHHKANQSNTNNGMQAAAQ
jgi:AsmA protein